MTSNGFARNILGPEELQLASAAFEAALAEVGESELHPYALRKNLAQYVMQKIFAGERDPMRLREGALASLRGGNTSQDAPSQDAHGVRETPILSNENLRPLFLAKA